LINTAFSVEAFLEGTRTTPEQLAEALRKGSILMAEDTAGHLLGSLYIEPRGQRGYLGMLAVHPDHQRQGLARHLTEEAARRLRQHGCTEAEITVLSLRPELPPLYRRWGFVEQGTVEFTRPLKPGFECHCIVMVKPL
jgi:ribosomal protein S18 acetylase RimI-like enzyme